MLIDFWSNHTKYGFHPDDIPHIRNDSILDWSVNDALAYKDRFQADQELHKMLHANLFPYPFVGDIERASVVILFGNPGVVPDDYLDEHRNQLHKQACINNLAGQSECFFLLADDSKGTGGPRYWWPRFRTLVDALAKELCIQLEGARNIAIQNIALIEAGAYRSKSSPGQWLDDLPSSQIAREYVHRNLLPQARDGETLLFVWRRASHWGISPETPGVIIRPPQEAQVAYLYQSERVCIVNHIRDSLV